MDRDSRSQGRHRQRGTSHVNQRRWTPADLDRTIRVMAKVTYDSKDDAGHKFWTARYGRYAIRIDANRPGVHSWNITLEGRSVRKGVAPDREEAANTVSGALDELATPLAALLPGAVSRFLLRTPVR